jgi:hypothetical protein
MPAFLTPQQLYEALETCVLDSLAIDVNARTARLELHVVNGGTRHEHSLTFASVARFTVDRPSTAPWDYVELSEIIVEPSKKSPGQWRFWAELWSKNSIEVIADRVLFDGSELRKGAA